MHAGASSFSCRKLVRSTAVRELYKSARRVEIQVSLIEKSLKRGSARKRANGKQRKSEIETAEAETINGDAVGATRVVGERAGGLSET